MEDDLLPMHEDDELSPPGACDDLDAAPTDVTPNSDEVISMAPRVATDLPIGVLLAANRTETFREILRVDQGPAGPPRHVAPGVAA